MLTLSIEADNKDQLKYALEIVAKLIDEGYTSGIDPTWDITGEDEEDDEDA